MVTKPLRMRQLPSDIKDDIDLENRLVNFLHARHVPGRESLHFDVRRGTVVVSGPLGSARAKWLCIECCRHVAGVVKLVDELFVECREIEPAIFARLLQLADPCDTPAAHEMIVGVVTTSDILANEQHRTESNSDANADLAWHFSPEYATV